MLLKLLQTASISVICKNQKLTKETQDCPTEKQSTGDCKGTETFCSSLKAETGLPKTQPTSSIWK